MIARFSWNFPAIWKAHSEKKLKFCCQKKVTPKHISESFFASLCAYFMVEKQLRSRLEKKKKERKTQLLRNIKANSEDIESCSTRFIAFMSLATSE